ncbi:RNA polymerase II transcription mediator complex subunit 9-domain-containing protein [Staphylotrichum tortipilum]|uniref:Mediator of RNA polymerase II transcription subunit 9 n=1 Tax=Staphylotrichum tortipilum TaxID=2831512 RepID=A0AAN6MPF0_9PEZI|nr:RNA polymerase II transcription mediator complex subunit 9-domain-containing protein [Staphylotrichum longicolle]
MSATHLPSGLSPDAVDALTELNAILTLLRNAHQQSLPTASQGATTANTQTTNGGVTGTTPLPIPSSAATPSNTNKLTTTAGATPADSTSIRSAKDLPAATDHLKHKLQRARAAMRGLADVQRSIGQQEAELRALEDRLRRQAGRLARTQEDGMRFVESEGARQRGEEEAALGRMVE